MGKGYHGTSIYATETVKSQIQYATLNGESVQNLAENSLLCVTRPTIQTLNKFGYTVNINYYAIELRKVGDVFDRLDLITGILDRKIGEIILDGSESWSLNIERDNCIEFRISTIFQNLTSQKVISSHFTIGALDTERHFVYNEQYCISILKSKLATQDVAGFKAWLKENPVTVFYELATPQEECVEVELIYALDDVTQYIQTQQIHGMMTFTVPGRKKYNTVTKTNNKITYIFDKQNLCIKQIAEATTYSVEVDEETNSKTSFTIMKQVDLCKGDFVYFDEKYFIIDSVEELKDEKFVNVKCADILHIFDRKLLEKDLDDMQNKSLETFISDTIKANFVQSNDKLHNIPYINVDVVTQTKTSQPTNAENMIYNFKTFLANCRQNKDIGLFFDIVQGTSNKLQIKIEKTQSETILIDTTLNDVEDYEKVYEVDPVTKVECYSKDTETLKTLYLRSDFTTTYDINDPLRVKGLTEVIVVEEEKDAEEQMLTVMRSNRYKHLVEFKIKKSSRLVDTKALKIGTPIKIKTFGISSEFDIYESYISAIVYSSDEFIKYKSGSLRVTLTDKLSQKF